MAEAVILPQMTIPATQELDFGAVTKPANASSNTVNHLGSFPSELRRSLVAGGCRLAVWLDRQPEQPEAADC